MQARKLLNKAHQHIHIPGNVINREGGQQKCHRPQVQGTRLKETCKRACLGKTLPLGPFSFGLVMSR
ncbi:MAG: hypothetical protein DRG71_01160 [Deltaproteobacteria bacterium]|nr:MAG: hypothetical protein DRG71_01160 [Deltaproteobacteria bacterium]